LFTFNGPYKRTTCIVYKEHIFWNADLFRAGERYSDSPCFESNDEQLWRKRLIPKHTGGLECYTGSCHCGICECIQKLKNGTCTTEEQLQCQPDVECKQLEDKIIRRDNFNKDYTIYAEMLINLRKGEFKIPFRGSRGKNFYTFVIKNLEKYCFTMTTGKHFKL